MGHVGQEARLGFVEAEQLLVHDGKVGVQPLQLDESVVQGDLGLDGQAAQVTGQQRRDAQEPRPKGEGRI